MRKWVKGDKSIAEAYARKTARELAKRGIVYIDPTKEVKKVVKKPKVKVEKIPKSVVVKVFQKIKAKKKEKKDGRRFNW